MYRFITALLLSLPLANISFAADECYSWGDITSSTNDVVGHNCHGVLGDYLCCETWSQLPSVCDEYELTNGDGGGGSNDLGSDPSTAEVLYDFELTEEGAVLFLDDSITGQQEVAAEEEPGRVVGG